jgi:hypothetical protein
LLDVGFSDERSAIRFCITLILHCVILAFWTGIFEISAFQGTKGFLAAEKRFVEETFLKLKSGYWLCALIDWLFRRWYDIRSCCIVNVKDVSSELTVYARSWHGH